MLLQHPHIRHHHAAVDCLAHVVNRQQADLDCGQCFHFHSGFAECFHLRAAVDAGCCSVDVEFDRDAGQCQRMAQRDQVAGAFGCHDGGNAGNAEHVAFFGTTALDDVERGRLHPNGAAGDGDAMGFIFGADIDHVGLAGAVEVGEFCGGVWWAVHKLGLARGTIMGSRYHSIVKIKYPSPKMQLLRRALSLALIVTMCVGPLAPLPVLALGLPTLGDSASDTLSPLMERKLGEEIMRDIRRNPDYLDDAPVLEYLNAFGSSLVAARPEARGEAGFDFFFFAVRDVNLNAFALPGGFVAVHSALVLAAQSESELASVMAHEIGHVAQRHIARMLGQQKQDALIPLAAILLGVLAASAGNVGDAPAALVMGGQGLAMQRQLNFSREAEREADRVGLQILQEANFDTSGMVAFFGRMQKASRGYSDAVPAYLRSHPLTTERIADIEARIRDQPHTTRPDSLAFHLIQARLRVLQDGSAQGLREAGEWFEKQLQQKARAQTVAAKYGLAIIALKQGATSSAQALLAEARVASLAPQNAIMTSLAIDIALASKNTVPQAVKQADAARAQFPLSRGIARQYAQALIAAGRYQEAVNYLRDQAQMYRAEPQLQQILAEAYAAQGRQALQHIALAESYALNGSLPDALQQLTIARRAQDATFYDQAIIDARERELQARWVAVLKEQGKKP